MRLDINQKKVAFRGDCFKNITVSDTPITLSVLLCCSSLLLFPSDYIINLLCFDYYAIINDRELWRLVTGHYVHSSFDHAFWDLIGFAACAGYVEFKRRELVLPTLLLSMATLGIYLMSPMTSLEKYSGLSGILYAYLLIACWIWRTENKGVTGWIPIIIVSGKTVLEIVSSNTVFVSQGWGLFYEAHLIGLITGAAILLSVHCGLKYKKTK